MALWLCRLDSQASLTIHGPDPVACRVQGWLLEADLTPAELRQPTNWHWYQHCGAGLPFGLDCRLLVPFTPAEEHRAATLLAPWLLREGSLRLQGRPVLLLRGAQQFSHHRFGPRGLRLALNSALRRLGCAQPLLLLCWQNDPVEGADAVIDDIPAMDEPPGTQPLNYEVFLRAAHHRPCPSATWRIPAVMAPADPGSSGYVNASAARYNEWLDLESSWSEFWLQGSAEAPVVVGPWTGHQRWWQAPAPVPPPGPSLRSQPSASPAAETSWGTQQAHHLALLVHGFHEPVLQWIFQQLPAGGGSGGLPAIDLYLSVPEDRYATSISLLRELSWPRVHIFAVPNRGRDLAPFLLKLLPAAVANNHQQFVKVHTKMSAHLSDGQSWGNHLLSSLLSPAWLQQLAHQLHSNDKLGLIAPSGTLLPCTLSLGRNRAHLLALCRRHQVPPRVVLGSRFIAGTMMAGRLEALKPLLQPPPSLEDFEAEAGQTDGTLAHAYERWIGVQAERHGWQVQELPGTAAAVPNFGYGWAEHPPAAIRDS
jgi:hypothetical protein